MQQLAMQGGKFETQLHESPSSASGLETVEFAIAGHAGTTPRALAKVASGGELARISLALSVIASRAARAPTLIFDKVDSSAVAEVVERHQMLCFTGLTQWPPAWPCATGSARPRRTAPPARTSPNWTRPKELKKSREFWAASS